MKTFKQLTVCDEFYMAYTNYEGKEKPKYHTIKVNSIELGEKDKEICLMINKKSGYSHGYSYDFILPIDKCDTNMVQKGDDGYYTTDRSAFVTILKNAGLKYINDLEKEIALKQKEIERVRSAYWEYLNNTVKEPITL